MPFPRGRIAQDDLLEAFRTGVSSRYRIERELGRGGMATVYLAQDLKHGRPVALKVLRPDLAAILGPDRFQREIDVAARLNHPNILPLYDSDEAGGSLYYVMPFVEGGTLRDRLTRGPRPGIREALGVARQIAAGLAHAHAQGLVHRDIKPGNILLSSGHAFLADFGIAWLVREAVDTERLTGTGLVLGTPAYMAPEQLATGARVDPRADQYALACVLHEMLLGHPPEREFSSVGAARRTILASRHDLPPEVAGALARALAADPDGRFPGIEQFAAAIDVAVEGGPRPSGSVLVGSWIVPRWLVYAFVLLLPAAVIAYALAGGRTPAGAGWVEPDTSRYAILPAETAGKTAAALNAEDLLHDAFLRWSGISLADGFQVRDAVERKGGSGEWSPATAAPIARDVGAGRYVLMRVTQVGDSLRVAASLYDIPSRGLLQSDHVMISASLAGADTSFAELADRLLFRGRPPTAEPGMIGSGSLPAMQAFVRGQDSIRAWNLAAADTAFTLAATLDPQYAEADLWLALVRAWSDQDPARWRYASEQALANRHSLSQRDQEIASAIAEQGRGNLASACARWMALAKARPSDFVGWFGAAYCLRSDDVVLPDSSSPSRYVFRSSYHTALQAYRHAFQLLPSILVTFRSGDFGSIRDLFYTSGTSLRPGRAPGNDAVTFAAYPSWDGDTLVLVPYPVGMVERGEVPQPALALAVRKQRALFHDVALTWATAARASALAQEALALSLEMLGDRAALDTLRRARRMASGDDARRIAGSEVLLMLKYGLPDDTASVRRAVALADSVVRPSGPLGAGTLPTLVDLAAFLGQVNRAASLAVRLAETANWEIARPVRQVAPALLVYSAFGAPGDSLRSLEVQVVHAIDQVEPAGDRPPLRKEWLLRTATLAFPHVRMSSLPDLASTHDQLLLAELAFAAGDSAAVVQRLAGIEQQRRGMSPSEFTFDRLFPEAWLLTAIGHYREAAAWLDPSLTALSTASPPRRADPAYVASLVQAMALRARIADALHDPAGARRWATAVAMLWRDADPPLRPIVQEMNDLAKGG